MAAQPVAVVPTLALVSGAGARRFRVVDECRSATESEGTWKSGPTAGSSEVDLSMLGNLGATCDGSTWVREGERDSFRVIVRGETLASLVDAVEVDLLAVAAACAPN